MQLTLTALERFVMNSLFPKQDSLENMLLQKSIAEKAQLTAEELDALKLQPVERGTKGMWSDVKEKQIEVTAAEVHYLRESIAKLDKARLITVEMLELCIKVTELESQKESTKKKIRKNNKKK